MSRITFDEYDAEHLYELSLQNFQDGCYQCEKIKNRLEKFIGKKEVRRLKRIVKNNPY
jgi:hypothetical protein